MNLLARLAAVMFLLGFAPLALDLTHVAAWVWVAASALGLADAVLDRAAAVAALDGGRA
jgi:hypothetical protein